MIRGYTFCCICYNFDYFEGKFACIKEEDPLIYLEPTTGHHCASYERIPSWIHKKYYPKNWSQQLYDVEEKNWKTRFKIRQQRRQIGV